MYLKRVVICILLTIAGSQFSSSTYVHANETLDIEHRLNLQKKLRVRAWCLVPWKNALYPAEILEIKTDTLTVKIFDTSLPLNQWPQETFKTHATYPMPFEKFYTEEALINSLKRSHILQTPKIEEAFKHVQRYWFCPSNPHFDAAIDIECGMCISAPHMHILALELMKEHLGHARSILDIGCGTGYMSAISAYLAPKAKVTGIEIFELLKSHSQHNCDHHLPPALQERIYLDTADGELGYAQHAPYDIIHVGFMCREVPQPLIDQLRPGGRLIIPVGNRISSYNPKLLSGDLMVIDKQHDGSIHTYKLFSCSFVPSQSRNS